MSWKVSHKSQVVSDSLCSLVILSSVTTLIGSLSRSSSLSLFLLHMQVHVLHCIQQVPGSAGYARFCDGFSIASAVREKNPTAFQLLSQYPVQYVDVGKNYLDYHVEAWHLPIR